MATLRPMRRRVWMRIPTDEKRQLFALTIKTSGHTVRSLAAESECAHSMIQALKTNPYKTCTADLAERICLALGVPSALFFVANASSKSGQIVATRRTRQAA